jgi:nitrate reductase delta subunit
MALQLQDRTLKALSLILSYPTRELQQAMSEIGAVLASDTRLTAAARRALRPLVEELAGRDIYDLEEQFVLLFDRSRTLSLNLFEHVHGESRDRGGAMVSLVETYRDGGFDPVTSELPDHLPVLLEFLSTRPFAEAQETLADAAHIFEALNARLVRRESPYGAVFASLLQLAGVKADQEAVAEMLAQPDDDPTDLEALDEVWEESEVLFGPDPNAGCPQVRDMLSRMDVPLPKTPPITPAPASHAAE